MAQSQTETTRPSRHADQQPRYSGLRLSIQASSASHDAGQIARQIVILLDGAATVMLIHRDVAYVEAAGETAASLIEQSRGITKRRLTASR